MNKLHGQWYRNDLLLQFYPENECYKLIDGEHAYAFREIMIRLAKR